MYDQNQDGEAKSPLSSQTNASASSPKVKHSSAVGKASNSINNSERHPEGLDTYLHSVTSHTSLADRESPLNRRRDAGQSTTERFVPRRPSSSSAAAASSSRRPSTSLSARRPSSSSASRRTSDDSSFSTYTAQSPPTTPKLGNNSSRSRILASSAVAIEKKGSIPLPLELRPRTASYGSEVGASPQSISRSGIVASTSSGPPSVAERKKRLASASGNSSVFEEKFSDQAKTPSSRSRQPSDKYSVRSLSPTGEMPALHTTRSDTGGSREPVHGQLSPVVTSFKSKVLSFGKKSKESESGQKQSYPHSQGPSHRTGTPGALPETAAKDVQDRNGVRPRSMTYNGPATFYALPEHAPPESTNQEEAWTNHTPEAKKKLGSPAVIDSERFVGTSTRHHSESQRSSTSSQQISLDQSRSKARPTTSDGTPVKAHTASVPEIGSPVLSKPRPRSRRTLSGTSSVSSSASPSPQARKSSLGRREDSSVCSVRHRSSSISSDSFASPDTSFVPSHRHDPSRRGARDSWRTSVTSITAAGAAGAGALAAIRATFGEQYPSSDSSVALASSGPSQESSDMPPSSETTVPDTLQVRREPLRPQKSPLRAERLPSSLLDQNIANRSVSEPVKSPAQISIPTSPSQQVSHPRTSIEDAVLAELMGREALADSGKSTSMTRSHGSHETISGTRLSTNGHMKTGDSASSLVDDDSKAQGDSGSSLKSFGKRSKTLRKITPPALAMAFSKQSAKASGLPQVDETGNPLTTEHPASSEIHASRDDTGVRKGKVWPFMGKDDKDALEKLSKTRLHRTMRGRKSETHSTRPAIRRVFDGGNEGLDDRSQDADSSAYSTDTFADSSALTSSKSNEALHQASIESPGTHGLHGTPSDSLPSHIKQLVRRRNAIQEIVETEKSYASDLAVIRDIYLARSKVLAGMSTSSPLQTPLSGPGTPFSPSAPSGPLSAPPHLVGGQFKTPLSASHTSRSQATSEGIMPATVSNTSPAPKLSGDLSNRSSLYTTSSRTSQSSDKSFVWPPPSANSLPGTPPISQSVAQAPKSSFAAISPYRTASPASSVQTRLSGTRPRVNVNVASAAAIPGGQNPLDTPLSMNDVRVIFASLESCATLAEEMSKYLHDAMGSLSDFRSQRNSDFASDEPKDDDAIGQAFLMLMPKIQSVYTAYCSRHEASMQRLQELSIRSPKAASFLKECTEVARKQTTAWDLGSLLIKPVQRVLKYPLLLRQVIGTTNSSHPDYPHLVAALDQMQIVADQINQAKRRQDLAGLLITGRVKDAKGITSATKTKRKVSSRSLGVDDTALVDPLNEQMFEDVRNAVMRFDKLHLLVQSFGKHCQMWSLELRTSYKAQLKIFQAMERVCALRSRQEEDMATVTSPLEPSSKEEQLINTYTDVMRTILNRCWRQMDSDIRSTILPMTEKIDEMFQAPRLVVLKRDEREADYLRYKISLKNDGVKNIERKVLENANGYIALQTQLSEELPQFLHGVEILLDVGVQAFARLQASHLDEVRHLTLSFWSKEGDHDDEVDRADEVQDETLNGGPSLRNVNPVRMFWESHRPYAQWIASLSITHRNSDQFASDGESFLTATEQGIGTSADTISGQTTPYQVTESRSSSTSHLPAAAKANANHMGNPTLLPISNPRKPGGVAGLMRSLSGTFTKEHLPSPSTPAPPLPTQAVENVKLHAEHPKETQEAVSMSVSELPPSLPSLVFRDEGHGGFFIQNSPIDFLDSMGAGPIKEPYGISPSIQSVPLPSYIPEKPLPAPVDTSDLEDGLEAPAAPEKDASHPVLGNGDVLASPTTQRHMIRDFYVAIATQNTNDVETPPEQHLGWPFVHFFKGDTFKVLSKDVKSRPGMTLLFGRIDRTGQLGWANDQAFVTQQPT